MMKVYITAFFVLFMFILVILPFLMKLQISDLTRLYNYDKCNSTMITGYFNISSKFSHEQYMEWMTNLLTVQDCLVIFTDPQTESTIRSLRPASYPSIVIPYTIDSFLVNTILTSEEWDEQEKMDPEFGIGHNRHLYAVWNEKTNMMKIVADTNPYFSSYFVWLDIGAMRHPAYNHQKIIRRFPEEKGVLLLNVEPFTEEDKILTDGLSMVEFTHKIRIGGGTICADTENLYKWHAAFYKTIKRYVKEKRFVGKDQNMMAATCLETSLCLLVLSGEWFRLQPWLRGDVNDTYTRLDIRNNNVIESSNT